MEAFKTLKGITVPLNMINVDTDQIIPKQFLKKIERTGFGEHLFNDWRYLDDEGKTLNPEFVLNLPRYKNAKIYGFKCIISSSFADIFFNNCRKNSILAVVLKKEEVQNLFEEIESNEGYELTVDLPKQIVKTPSGGIFSFDVDIFAKNCLLKGLDDIGWTLQFEDRIKDFEKKVVSQKPWLFLSN